MHISTADIERLINKTLSRRERCCFSPVDLSSPESRQTASVMFRPSTSPPTPLSIWEKDYKPLALVDANEAACPLSSQVLRLTSTILSHPLPARLATGVACCLSNDDASIFGYESSGVSPDFSTF